LTYILAALAAIFAVAAYLCMLTSMTGTQSKLKTTAALACVAGSFACAVTLAWRVLA